MSHTAQCVSLLSEISSRMFSGYIFSGTRRTRSPPWPAVKEAMPGQPCCTLGFYTAAIFSCYQPRCPGPIIARWLQETLPQSKLHSLQSHREEPNDREFAALKLLLSCSLTLSKTPAHQSTGAR